MNHRPSRFATGATRRWVLWCVLLALPLCGLSSMLSATLGPVHFHRIALQAAVDSSPMAGWQDFRRINHVSDSAVHVHDHTVLGRHHHEATDASLVVVGSTSGDDIGDGAAAAVVGLLVLATAAAASFRLPVLRGPSEWLTAHTCAFRSCDPRRLERPPIA